MQSITVQVENLSKRYGANRIFDGISFSHSRGVMGIAGANGSGKSTLLQCLAGLEKATSGVIDWTMGENKIETPTLKENTGYAAPYINLYEEFTAAENLGFLLRLRSIDHKSKTITRALEKTGIAHRAEQLYGNLSTGQQQRVRLAAALVHAPEVLFLDEPGSNLDEAGREMVENVVDEYKVNQKLVFIASNNLEELALCDRVYSVEQEQFQAVSTR